jgi:hypothetical protein
MNNYPVQGQGAQLRGMAPYSATLGAGGSARWQVAGNWFQVTSSPVNDLIVRFDSGQPIPLMQGQGMSISYSEFSISSATGQAVTVFAGYGQMSDSRANLVATFNVTVGAGASIDDGADVATVSGSASLLLPVDLTRKTAIICNPTTNTVSVRVGSSSVGAAKGVILEPGESLEYPTTAAIYAYQASGGAVTLTASAIRV